MKLTGIFIAFCCTLVLFAACKKSEDDDNKTQAQKTLETGKWQMSASVTTVTYQGQDTVIDSYSQMDACKKDDIIEFAGNGEGTVEEGANSCSGAKTWSFTWGLLNNDTRIYIADSNPDTMDVVELTSTQMKLKLTNTNSAGAVFADLFTYKNIP